MRRPGVLLAVIGLALVVAAPGAAGTIVGTPRGDTLRGTQKADRIDGRGGNDRLFGRGGNDLLVGGPGNDVLDGGAGRDGFRCGPGNDVAVVQPGEDVARDCENVRGLPVVAIGDVSVAEGDAGTTAATFALSLSRPVSVTVRVRYATADGTATAPGDYVAASGEAMFAPGRTTTTISIAVVADTVVEPDESFTVSLTGVTNATIGSASATGEIRNDDAARPRAGTYSGTTSQGKSLAFDVSADLTRLSSMRVVVDIECPSIAFQYNDLELTQSGSVAITPGTWQFEVTLPVSGGITGTFSLTGALSLAGAGGTLRLDFEAGGTRCTSNNVPWSAR